VTRRFEIREGSPHRLGARCDGEGTNFTVFSENASKVELCLFSNDGQQETDRLTLPEKSGPIWHGFVPGLSAGALYGFRAHGQYAPEQGHRFNPHKLLLDPYTRELRGEFGQSDTLLGYQRGHLDEDLSFSTTDSAQFMAKSVVSDPDILATLRDQVSTEPDSDLIYEAHVKGLTQQHPLVPDHLKGTYEGLASDQMIEHFQRLGVQSVELLPVHSFVDESFLQARGLRNYWGYNSIGFFAPEPRYFGPAGVLGFRKMVGRLKAAGISTILDVVYNHTAEGDQRGPTLCYRGLDNASYYRLLAGQPRYYVNDTGCGNTLNVAHPVVLRMVMDSLRYWVEVMGVGGFRFDLATTLGREDHGFDPRGSFFDTLQQDPVLSKVRLIAEPWDIGPGGYQLGAFPHGFSEWNDQYRDTLRRYWRGDDHSAQELAACLLGSAHGFDRAGRKASASVNFVTSHDGFTLADVTRYNQRHNEANTENNKDGHHSNFSDNCGVEGETDDADIRARRSRRQRNMLATLFVSQGTPMLLAGDEMSNSQQGNNNAYCQDNPTAWVDWQKADGDMQRFVERLSGFRAAHPVLRQSRFLHGATRSSDGTRDVDWTDLKGRPMEWRDPGLSGFILTLRTSAEAPPYTPDSAPVAIVFNRDAAQVQALLPDLPEGAVWVREFDTAETDLPLDGLPVSGSFMVQGETVVILALRDRDLNGSRPAV